MRTSTGLPNLRLAAKSIPIEAGLYTYDGPDESLEGTLQRVGSELETHAINFFEQREREINDDAILNAGLEWLRSRKTQLPLKLFVEREKPFFGRKLRVRTVEHPIMDDLKSFLRKECDQIGASASQRKETAVLAMDLLAYVEAGML